MATSGTTAFNAVREQIIYGALRMVGAYSIHATPQSYQVTQAEEALNMMLKAWQTQSFLWLRRTVSIDCVASQASYNLTGTNYITKIYSAHRKDSNGNYVELNIISQHEYYAKSDKTATGRVVDVYLDKQLSTAVLYTWPTSDNATDDIILVADRIIEDITADGQTFDVPQYWLETIKYGLAVRLAPEYGIPLNERMLLDKEYAALVQNALSYDTEDVSLFLEPEFRP